MLGVKLIVYDDVVVGAKLAARELRRIDVLHVNTAVSPLLLMMLFKASRKPVVLTVHGITHGGVRDRVSVSIRKADFNFLLLPEAAKLADVVVSISNFVRRNLLEYGVESKVIYHGVDHELFKPREQEKEGGVVRVLWNSRFVDGKDPFTLIKAFLLIYREAKGLVHLTMKGRGPLLPLIMRVARKHGLLQAMTFDTSWVSYVELPKLYQDHDVFVHTSPCEPFGLVVLEAAASGLPLVVPRAGGAYEVAGYAAIPFEPGDPYSLAEVILDLIFDEKKRKYYSQIALKRSREFTWRKAAQMYYKIYSSIT